MVKYSDDPDYTHEQMELSTAYDLRYARIVQAQIDSINSTENCAAITLSNECAELAGKSVAAVKFFYHCEYSTGTVEDLDHGHEAFVAGDFVLVLWVPDSSSVEEQFCIIGHVDKRGTQRCKIGEVLYLMTAESETSGRMYCFFDTGTGQLLDIDGFANIDDGSPTKPASAIGLYTSAVGAWRDYNFTSPPVTVTIPHSWSVQSLYMSANNGMGSTTSYTAYTGTTGFITGSSPVDCAEWFDPGNGIYHKEFTTPYTDQYDSSSQIGTEIETTHMSGPFGSHADANENSCTTCWGHTDWSLTRTIEADPESPGRCFMRLIDTISSQNYDVLLGFTEVINQGNTSTLGSGVFYAEATHSVTYEATFDFSDLLTPKRVFSISSESAQAYQLNAWPAYGADGTSVPQLSEDGSVYESKGPLICSNEWSSPVLAGHNGAYVVVCSAIYYSELLAEGELFKGYVGSAQNPAGRGNGFKALYSDVWLTTGENGEEIVIGSSTKKGHFKVFPSCLVSTYTEEFGAGTQVSIAEVRANANPIASYNLATAIVTMYDMMDARLEILGDTDKEGFYDAQVLLGPTKIALTKKGT